MKQLLQTEVPKQRLSKFLVCIIVLIINLVKLGKTPKNYIRENIRNVRAKQGKIIVTDIQERSTCHGLKVSSLTWS